MCARPAISRVKIQLKFLNGRCLFVPRQGYLGLGSEILALPGDSAVVWEGGAVPYPLREPKNNTYIPNPTSTDLCHSYVHGIIDGEVSTALEQGIGD
jgi:hypothetical protein